MRYPIARILMLAHCTRATGRLRLFDGERSQILVLRDSAVVECQGILGLATALAPSAPPDLDLTVAIPTALRAGADHRRALEEASRVVGTVLAGWCVGEVGMVSWRLDPSQPGTGVRLEQNLIAMLSYGLQLSGSVEAAQRLLDVQPSDPVSAILPRAGGDQSLGLDAVALRIMTLARATPSLQDLVAQATRGNSARRREVLHRVTLLLRLGLLNLPDPPLSTEEDTVRVPRPTPRPRRAAPAPGEPAPAPRSGSATDTGVFNMGPDEAVARLRKRSAALQSRTFFQRLGLGDVPERPGIEQVEEAFRKLSRSYHPDTHIEAAPEVREAAAEVFALFSEAVEGLRRPRTAEEQWERTRCAQQGVPYVTDRDRTKAKMSFVKGEKLMRNKDYAIAEACFHEAKAKDPLNPLYAFMHAQAAFLARQMPAEEAIRIIDGLPPGSPKQASQFQHAVGRILQISGAPVEKVAERFQKAVELDPENRDAQRELRLRAMRTEPKPAAPSPWSFPFLDRFRKKPTNGS